MIKVEGCMCGNEEQRRVLDRAFRLRVEDLHRVFPLVELILQELVVFLGLDIALVLRP